MRPFAILALCALFTSPTSLPSFAQSILPDCGADTVGVRCVERREEIGPWQIEVVVPPVGSQNALLMTSQSFQPLPGIFGQEEHAELTLSCIENTTGFEVRFGQNFMSSVGDFGTLIYKVDDEAPVALETQASPDNEALGFYAGADAIPLIRSLFGGERLLVSATSFTGRTLNASFSIEQIEPAVSSLRDLCNW